MEIYIYGILPLENKKHSCTTNTKPHFAAIPSDFGIARMEGQSLLRVLREESLWDTTTGEQKFTLTGHTHSVFDVTYSPDGKTIATRNGNKEDFENKDLQKAVSGISVWDTDTAERKVTIAEHPCYTFMYSPDSSTIITYGMHGVTNDLNVFLLIGLEENIDSAMDVLSGYGMLILENIKQFLKSMPTMSNSFAD